jgi:small subunit ribosomal protein S3|uniref:ribosomal protein S3 n=1 Tax=Cryptomonas gyropyrenoidosa TaxID=233257 RepID=UPI00279AC329|nr:ribosomal protein S3 [Cryptomonas gyropyrenoidosa]WFQ83005.1 ribosomal protein S3 [Cryptomonas gyropyrenoidosa]
MGQKTHPLGFRLNITQKHKSSWYENKHTYKTILREDFIIRSYLEKSLQSASISKIEIHRKSDQVELCLHTSRPGIIVGRSGAGIEKLKEELSSLLSNGKQIRINVYELSKPDADAVLIAEFIAQQLEKRVAFRRATRQAIQKAQRVNVQGIKVQVSGRLNGAEIARSEWVREGRVPLQTLRADIDYAVKRAQTTYGVLGIKVWVFNGELEPNYNILNE